MASASVGFLCSDDGDRHTVDDEHHVGPVGLASRRLEPPFPGDVQDVGAGLLEVDQPDGPLAILGLVVPVALAPQPGQHLAVALDRCRQRLQPLKGRADSRIAHPRVEAAKRSFELIPEQQSSLAPRLSVAAEGGSGLQPTSSAWSTIGNWTVPASEILSSAIA